MSDHLNLVLSHLLNRVLNVLKVKTNETGKRTVCLRSRKPTALSPTSLDFGNWLYDVKRLPKCEILFSLNP